MGGVKFEADPTDGYATLTVTDGNASYVKTGLLPLNGWHTLVINIIDGVVFATIDGNDTEPIQIPLSNFTPFPVVLRGVQIVAAGITQFFAENYGISISRMANILRENADVCLGSTNAYELLIPPALLPEKLNEYYIVVRAYNEAPPLGEVIFEYQFAETDFIQVTTPLCFVWDTFLDYADNWEGVTFFVDYKDSKLGFTKLPNKFAMINKQGFFGLYLPVGVIYTVKLMLYNRYCKFIVPAQDKVRLSDVARFTTKDSYFS
jgi:hypothetical protein